VLSEKSGRSRRGGSRYLYYVALFRTCGELRSIRAKKPEKGVRVFLKGVRANGQTNEGVTPPGCSRAEGRKEKKKMVLGVRGVCKWHRLFAVPRCWRTFFGVNKFWGQLVERSPERGPLRQELGRERGKMPTRQGKKRVHDLIIDAALGREGEA